jgi:N6-L-threonylcarbamoyladenine synthase
VGRALKLFKATFPEVRNPMLVVAGGVAANRKLKSTFETLSARHGFGLIVPPTHLCTDNAAMVAWAGAERLACGLTDPLDAQARARWPLDPAAQRMTGAGVKA